MMRLLRVELSRLLARRAVLLILLAAVAVPVVIGAGVAWKTRPVSAADREHAERQVADEAKQP